MKKSYEELTGRDVFFTQMARELEEIIDPKTGFVNKEHLEEILCPLCSSNRKSHEELMTKQGFHFVRCNECDLIFVNPRIRQEIIKKSYESDSMANEAWVDVLLSPAETQFQTKDFSRLLDLLTSFQSSGRLLDVGCSIGRFLDLARKRGFETIGLELSQKARRYAQETLELEVLDKTLEEIHFPEASFDVVIASGVLEHVVDPVQFLREVNRVLKIGGIILVGVPNVYSLAAMMMREITRTFTGMNHLTYFSEATLAETLRKTGYDIVHTETDRAALDSILNYAQFKNPFEPVNPRLLPAEIKAIVEDVQRREELETLICAMGLGYRLRTFARKVRNV